MQHPDSPVNLFHASRDALEPGEVKRLLLIDDHPIMRYGLAQLVADEPGLEICGQAGTAKEGLAALEQLQPDLVVIDLTLPDRNGLELLKDIQALQPGQLCLVLSMHDESMYAERALRAGARGYLMKEVAAEQFIQAVQKVLSGGLYVSEAISGRMLEQAVSGRVKRPSDGVSLLTDRELEVLEWIGSGRATKLIAEQMGISTRTVEAHRAHIKDKLGLTDGAELVRYAVQWVEARGQKR